METIANAKSPRQGDIFGHPVRTNMEESQQAKDKLGLGYLSRGAHNTHVSNQHVISEIQISRYHAICWLEVGQFYILVWSEVSAGKFESGTAKKDQSTKHIGT